MVSYVAANIDVMKWFWVKVIVQKVKLKEGGCIPREMRFPSGPGIPPGLSKLKDRGGRLCSTNEVNHLLIWTPCKKGRLENVTITRKSCVTHYKVPRDIYVRPC